MKKILTTAELAAYLGMHEKSLIRWRAEKRGPEYFRSGDSKKERVFYRISDVKKWEKENNFVKVTR